jgi:hypothetical protein
MKKYIYIILTLISIGFTGCEKILDKDPIDKLSLEDIFKDINGAKTALSGAYRTLLATDLYHQNLMLYPELIGGNLKYSRTVNVQLNDVYNLTQIANSSSLNVTYAKIYDQLNNLNNIIKYTPEAVGLTSEKNRVLAEAKCLRALAHFDALRIFSRPYNYTPNASHLGIVINLKPQLLFDPSPVRLTAAESYQAVINDLTEAITLFDSSSAIFSKGSLQTYFSKNAAKALLAKVYLYTNNYTKAFELSDEIIKNGGYTLLSNTLYVNSWTTRTPSTESIFELALESDFSGNSIGSYYEATNIGGYRMFAATNDLLGLYSATDVRGNPSLFTNVNISGTSYFFTKKYATGSTLATPVKILRLSEIYLIRAEAAVEKTNTDFTQANADLNTIIKRADPSAVTANYSVKTDLVNAILLERRKELAFEGNLLFDLLRKGKDIVRNDCNASICNLPNTDYRLVMPFPAETVNANRSMVQNQGY